MNKFYRDKGAINVCQCIINDYFIEVRENTGFCCITTGNNPLLLARIRALPKTTKADFLTQLKRVKQKQADLIDSLEIW